MKRIYVASPLFNQSERDFNCMIAEILSQRFKVHLPQRDGDLLVNLVGKGMNEDEAKKKIFYQDVEAIDDSDYLLIVLDGRAVDEGACFELGYAFSKGKTCYGLQTDSRRLLKEGNNPMIDTPLMKVFHSVSELNSWVIGENVIRVA